MASIANIPVNILNGGCLLDISALIDISICPTIDIVKGSKPHKIHNEPQTICVTPSVSTPSVRPFLTSTLSTSTVKAIATADPVRTGPGLGPGSGPGSNGAGSSPASYCSNPLVDVDLMLLGILDVDLSVYLDLSHLLDLNIDLNLGDLLSGKTKPKLPKSVKHGYKPTCGKTLASHPNATSCTATDYNDCLARCEKDAIKATVELGNLVDCLGVTIKNGIHVDNCLTVTGSSDNLIDLDIDLLGSDDTCDSFVYQK